MCRLTSERWGGATRHQAFLSVVRGGGASSRVVPMIIIVVSP